jgi:1,4-alpha-glucan branching enzyme
LGRTRARNAQPGASGVWEIFIPGVFEGALYKYEIRDANGRIVLKTDP